MKSAMLVGDARYGAVYESKEIFAGLMWMAPGVDYPEHAHDAGETWTILSGVSQWRLGEESPRSVAPGESLHIPTTVGHAVTTLDEPLLAFYIWTGDIYGRYWFHDADLAEKEHRPTVDPKQTVPTR